MAMPMLRRPNPPTLPYPNEVLINPPTMAPAIPMRIVTMNPPGSFSGMMLLASTPAINPNTIQDMMPCDLSPLVEERGSQPYSLVIEEIKASACLIEVSISLMRILIFFSTEPNSLFNEAMA